MYRYVSPDTVKSFVSYTHAEGNDDSLYYIVHAKDHFEENWSTPDTY